LRQGGIKNIFTDFSFKFLAFYSKTPRLKTDASRFVSVSAELVEKMSGSAVHDKKNRLKKIPGFRIKKIKIRIAEKNIEILIQINYSRQFEKLVSWHGFRV